MARPTALLPQSDDFRYVYEETPIAERIELAHRRARAIVAAYKPSLDDVLSCSQKFWDMHTDMINGFDGSAVTLWTLQLNLAGGTIAPFVKGRPELETLWDNIINFRVTAHFMLTERAHGLDAPNIETEATLLPDGGFDLHTPHDGAAKFMPASIPSGGLPRIAVVMARLKIDGKDHGIRPFVVPINDGRTMCAGVTSRPLPTRAGSKPLGHAITTFAHVRLPPAALLGALAPARNPRAQFLADIWRIGVGSICLTAVTIPALKLSAYIVARYSQRRTVTSPQGKTVPIIAFRTQQAPILHALAQGFVLEAFYNACRGAFTQGNLAPLEYRNGLSTVFKTVAVQHWRESSLTLADRCGAQGLFDHNMIVAMQMEIRGVTIAEGDVLVLCIRLASELLLGRYTMHAAADPAAPLAAHEAALFAELRAALAQLPRNHRGAEFDRRILPRAVPLVRAMGHRMAADAARAARVDPALVELYEARAVLDDLAWYVEAGVLSRAAALAREEAALDAALPRLEAILEATGAAPYAVAPIVTAGGWERFVETLPVLRGQARVDPYVSEPLGEALRARL